MLIGRRAFLTGLLAAPIIVRAGIIMPVRPLVLDPARMADNFLLKFYDALRPGLSDLFQEAYLTGESKWWIVFENGEVKHAAVS